MHEPIATKTKLSTTRWPIGTTIILVECVYVNGLKPSCSLYMCVPSLYESKLSSQQTMNNYDQRHLWKGGLRRWKVLGEVVKILKWTIFNFKISIQITMGP